MERLQLTSLTTQNISSALLVDTYTATADKELLIQLYLSGLAGNGTYRACLTKTLVGGGTYQTATTSVAAAATVTTVFLPTTPLPVKSGDVVKVYCQGLSTDTSVSIKIETFDVTAAATGAAMTLTACAISSTTFAGSAINSTVLAASVINSTTLGLTAASQIWNTGVRALTDKVNYVLAASSIGASTIAASAIGPQVLAASTVDRENFALTAASKVWDANVRALTDKSGFGATATLGASAITACTLDDDATAIVASAVWAYGSRTLTQSIASITQSISDNAGKVTIKRGDSLSVSFTDLGTIADRSELWFTAKKHKGQTDAQSQVMISESAGLLYLNGGAPTAASGADINVTNAASGHLTVTMAAAETKNLSVYPSYFYDIQVKRTSGSVSTLTESFLEVTDDVTLTTT